jgi:hypothetical protein
MDNLHVNALVILIQLNKLETLEAQATYLTQALQNIAEEAKVSGKDHYCPGHQDLWSCDQQDCRAAVEMLCPDCDDEDARERLGGKWLD